MNGWIDGLMDESIIIGVMSGYMTAWMDACVNDLEQPMPTLMEGWVGVKGAKPGGRDGMREGGRRP